MADNEGSTSDNSSTSKEKSSSKKSVEHEATPAAAPPPPPPPKEKKSGGGIVSKIIAIVALLLAIVAVALSAVLTTYWWNWPWAVTTPALALGLTALILAFLKSDGAALTAGGVGVILAIGAIVWCAIDLAQINSYQGPLEKEWTEKRFKNVAKSLTEEYKNPILKAKHLYSHHMKHCAGKAFDWSYRKEWIVLKRNCAKETAEAIYAKKEKVDPDISKLARYDGADSYDESPIYATHKEREERNANFYTMKEEKKTTAREALDNFCEANFEVEAFLTAREKCDAALETKFKPQCSTKYKTYAFSEGTMEELGKLKACQVKVDKKIEPYLSQSKFVLAMGGEPKFFDDLKKIFKKAQEMEEEVKKMVINRGGSEAEAEEFAKKAANAIERGKGLGVNILKRFETEFELQRNMTEAEKQLGELMRNNDPLDFASPVQIEKYTDEMKKEYERAIESVQHGADPTLDPTKYAKRFAEKFKREKKQKGVKKKLRELLKAKGATPEEIKELTDRVDRQGIDVDEIDVTIAEGMAAIFLAQKKVETDLKAKGATEEEIDDYRKEFNRRVDMREYDREIEEIADKVVKEFEKRKAVEDEVKKQLKAKGATEEEIEEIIDQGIPVTVFPSTSDTTAKEDAELVVTKYLAKKKSRKGFESQGRDERRDR